MGWKNWLIIVLIDFVIVIGFVYLQNSSIIPSGMGWAYIVTFLIILICYIIDIIILKNK